MKRFLCLSLLWALLLSGCLSQGQPIREPVTFYYLRSEYQYGSSQSILDWEERESSVHREDLTYLMTLYLMGPNGENLRSPWPAGTRLLSAETGENTVTLTLSEVPASMTDAAYTLACACLTKTCMALTGADSVTILSGTRSVTMNSDNLILTDSGVPIETEETP